MEQTQPVQMDKKDASYYANNRREMMSFIPIKQIERVLEVGCGSGNFRCNFDDVVYWGVEPNQDAAERARTKLSKVLAGTYETVADQIPESTFDLVVCNDVIEHMVDPRQFLYSVRKKLKSGGCMIVSLPNLRNAQTLYDLIVRGRFDYTHAGVLDYTHYHLFTMRSFCDMAGQAGWRVEKCQELNRQPFKPLKGFLVSVVSLFITEFGSTQFGALLKPCTPHV